MSAQDARVFKKLADMYTLNDNYHQPVMGGTAVQHIMIGTADAIPWDTFRRVHAIPVPLGHIANPVPIRSSQLAFNVDEHGPTVPTPPSPEFRRL